MIRIYDAISSRLLGEVEVSKTIDFLKTRGAEIADHSFRYALRSGLIYVAGAVAYAGRS